MSWSSSGLASCPEGAAGSHRAVIMPLGMLDPIAPLPDAVPHQHTKDVAHSCSTLILLLHIYRQPLPPVQPHFLYRLESNPTFVTSSPPLQCPLPPTESTERTHPLVRLELQRRALRLQQLRAFLAEFVPHHCVRVAVAPGGRGRGRGRRRGGSSPRRGTKIARHVATGLSRVWPGVKFPGDI